jgi:hypothetical protein
MSPIRQRAETVICEVERCRDCRHKIACSATSMRRAPEGPSSLVLASLPPVQTLADDSFGATTQALIDTSLQYRKRACAAGIAAVCSESVDAMIGSGDR